MLDLIVNHVLYVFRRILILQLRDRQLVDSADFGAIWLADLNQSINPAAAVVNVALREKFATRRSSNLSYAEKLILVELLVKHRVIIDNKKTDAVSSQMKLDGWKQLAEEFCAEAVGGTSRREWQQLKNVRIICYVVDSIPAACSRTSVK